MGTHVNTQRASCLFAKAGYLDQSVVISKETILRAATYNWDFHALSQVALGSNRTIGLRITKWVRVPPTTTVPGLGVLDSNLMYVCNSWTAA
jgi:hypothetical protein